jgi:TRAP-type uncharacterized transport system fused permease subunit
MSESFSDLTIHYSIIVNAAVRPCVHAVFIAQDTSSKKRSLEIPPRTAGTNRAYKLELSPVKPPLVTDVYVFLSIVIIMMIILNILYRVRLNALFYSLS